MKTHYMVTLAAPFQADKGLARPRITSMTNAIRLFVAAFVLSTLAACATQAQPDLTPPPQRDYDAKTQLETGRAR